MEVSLLANYDNLIRMMNKILEFNCEPEFLRFVINQEECRQKWLASIEECHRLSKELERSHKDIKEREIKLHHARRLLDQESKLRRKAESERDSLEAQLTKVKELLFSNPLNDETREKLAFLSNTTVERPSTAGRDPRHLDTISEGLDSTGSIISDLGYSRSEDDLDESITRGPWKFRRSSPNTKEQTNQNKRRRSENMNQESQKPKPVILTGKGMKATTLMSMTPTGTITAHSRIEALPTPSKKPKSPVHEPTAPAHHSPKNQKSESSDDSLCRNNEAETSPNVCGYVFGVNNKKMLMRSHDFVTKTVLRPETCNPCGKRIKFGTVILKCIDCRASAHPACRNKVPLPCIAVPNTPKVKDFNGLISDYTPRDSPMVPALIIHCLNEIERRGLTDVGLYRVPGSEKEVKVLKERFLRGKGIPNLGDIDIHAICSTVKDFLRSLRQPLIYSLTQSDLVNVVNAGDLETIRSNIYQVISELPQPNRDTLAYLILHLQRMSQNPECKMNISNISKIFAITVIGVANDNLPQDLILEDIQNKINIMEHLMMIPSEYWNSFMDVEPAPPVIFRTPIHPSKSASSVISASPFLTPLLSNRTPRRAKFFNTPPSAKC